MSTMKTRINVSISSDVERAIIALAKRDQVPNATKAAELLRQALEIEEDRVFDAIGSKREEGQVKFVSHKMAWR